MTVMSARFEKERESWRIDFTYRDANRNLQRFRLRTGAPTSQREADKLERELRKQVEKQIEEEIARQQTPAEPVRCSAAFSGFARHWFDTYVTPGCKPSTRRGTEQVLRVHLVPWFGDADLRAIGVERIEAYKAAKVAAGLTAKTVNNQIGILGKLWASAVDWGYADVNPVRRVRKLRLPLKDFTWWTPEQSDAFLAEARQHDRDPWYGFFLLALRTGLRLGEICALRWGDVDLDRKVLTVRRSWSAGHETSPKSGKARTLPMTDDLVAEMRWRRARTSSVCVFPASDGERLDRNRVKHPFWRCIKAAGVPEIRIHDMRHTFASQLVTAGVSLRVVQDLLGHSTITMTERYAHLAPEVRHDAVGVLERHGPIVAPRGQSGATTSR